MVKLLAATVAFSLAVTVPFVVQAQGNQGKKPNAAVIAKCRAKYPEPTSMTEKVGRGRQLGAMRRQCIASGGRM